MDPKHFLRYFVWPTIYLIPLRVKSFHNRFLLVSFSSFVETDEFFTLIFAGFFSTSLLSAKEQCWPQVGEEVINRTLNFCLLKLFVVENWPWVSSFVSRPLEATQTKTDYKFDQSIARLWFAVITPLTPVVSLSKIRTYWYKGRLAEKTVSHRVC